MKLIHLIVGARPNFMKMAPLYKKFKEFADQVVVKLIHTGQHYDEKMSKLFFDDLEMPVPDYYLEVGSGSQGEQTAKIMTRYEAVLVKEKPDLIVVAGDVNSTMACAIDAVKLHIPVAHLEAGLRSYDRHMPEEINRIITDSISELLLIPSLDAKENLLKEGVDESKIKFVGNIMIDSLKSNLEKADTTTILESLQLQTEKGIGDYILVTLHRPSNVDTKEGIEIILSALQEISKTCKIVFPVHPRTKKHMQEYGLLKDVEKNTGIVLTEPIGYLEFLKIQMHALLVITDSGGIQEETSYLGIPCLTLRENTERPITITEGTNQLVKLKSDIIIDTAKEKLKTATNRIVPIIELWDGNTAQRTVEVILQYLHNQE